MLSELSKEKINRTLESITEEFGPVYSAEFVQMSVLEIQKRLDKLQDCFENRQSKKFQETAHGFISLCGNIGLQESAQLARQLESLDISILTDDFSISFRDFLTILHLEILYAEECVL